ncbi:hypothetical protein V8E54_008440 [Elaphomyces granulatus]
MLVVGRVCGITTKERYLAVLVDGFTFYGGSDGASQLASPQTPLATKRPLKDLWDRTDADDIGEGPSTSSSSKVRRLVFDHESPSPLGSSQVEVPGTPLPTDDTPTAGLDHSPDAEQDDELTTAQGKQPQRG